MQEGSVLVAIFVNPTTCCMGPKKRFLKCWRICLTQAKASAEDTGRKSEWGKKKKNKLGVGKADYYKYLELF